MLDADIQLVWAYINKGNYTAAQTQINTLPTTKSAWATLLNQYLALESGPKKQFALKDYPAALSNIFYNYANSTTGIDGQESAKALLKFVLDRDYFIPHPIPVGTSAAKFSQTENEIKPDENTIISNSEIMLYPNPTQNGINIIYKSQADADAVINVNDLLGKVVYSSVIMNSGKLYVPLNDLSSGLYLITITRNNKEVIYKAKLIKQD
jgi:hypothetical protein